MFVYFKQPGGVFPPLPMTEKEIIPLSHFIILSVWTDTIMVN